MRLQDAVRLAQLGDLAIALALAFVEAGTQPGQLGLQRLHLLLGGEFVSARLAACWRRCWILTSADRGCPACAEPAGVRRGWRAEQLAD